MSMSPAMNRFAAVSLTVLSVLAIVFYGLVPLANVYAENSRQIALQQKRLDTYRNLAANAETIDAAVDSAEDQARLTNLFLTGENQALASANLRALVNNAVQQSGGVLISSDDYQAQPLAGTAAVGLRLRVNGEVRNLVDLLHELESARPLVFVENLSINSSAGQPQRGQRNDERGGRDRRGGDRRQQFEEFQNQLNRSSMQSSLDIRMDVVGYLPKRES